MSNQEGNCNNLYTFDDYLFVKDNFNYYVDDPFFQALSKNLQYKFERYFNISIIKRSSRDV